MCVCDRVVILNSMLNVILIFFLSFLKMFVMVWENIMNLQRRCLWGGMKSLAKIFWVNWNDLCKLKSNRGSNEGGIFV